MNPSAPVTAAARGLAICHSCGKVQPEAEEHCRRCDAALHLRKPQSLQRTWAFTVTAAIMYFPANLLPIMRSEGIGGGESNTILSGIVLFWEHGSYLVAIIIFSASVLIPIAKLIAIVVLCRATYRCANPVAMTRIYRVTELVGRWSMLDVFVVAILVAVVQLGSIMSIDPGPAAVAFASVVILTMLAAMAFDPRLIWDAHNRNPAPQKNRA
jgi:paraquat-inducible protein A